MYDPAREIFQGLSRRHFLRASAGAALAALAGSEPSAVASESAKIEPQADTLILLWMAGGMAQT